MSANLPSAMEMIRDGTAEWLRGFGDFAGIEILTRKQGDPYTRAQESLGKNGVVVTVAVLSAMPQSGQSARIVQLDPINVIVECAENVPVNQSDTGTGKGAMFLAERAVACLNVWTPPLPPEMSPSPFVPEPPGIDSLPALKEFPNVYVVQAHFTTRCLVLPRQL